MMGHVRAIFVGELLLGLVASLAFVVLYALRSDWFSNLLGRNAMWLGIALAWLMAVLLLAITPLPDEPEWFGAVGLGAVDLILIERVVLLVRIQRNENLEAEVTDFGTWISQRRKGLAAFIAFAAVTAQQALPLSPSVHAWCAFVAALAGFVGVYSVRNEPVPKIPATPAESDKTETASPAA